MSVLVEKLTAPEVRPRVVAACVDLVQAEVDAKKGFSGAAIKTGYKVVKALKPGMISNAIDKLLPEFAQALQPMYDESTKGADDAAAAFEKHLASHPEEAADALLTVTDARATRADNKTIQKTYERLRGGAKDNVKAAVPGLAKTLCPFLK